MDYLQKPKSSKQRVLERLMKGPATRAELNDIAGHESTRRVRDLRDQHGIPVKWEYIKKNGKKTKHTRYELLVDPGKINVSKLCVEV